MLSSSSSTSTPAKEDSLFIQTKSEGGSRETEVIDETVIANLFPSFGLIQCSQDSPTFS